jgi:2-keto-4-pentenoate hydratase/2-oxohepta-3-ene-1,7-dioic acid hydratase in catechol pathway
LPQARLFCVGANYPKPHPLGGVVKGPANISFFIKHQAALVAQGEALQPPGVSEQFDYECELALVIGRAGHRIAARDAMAHVAGYTVMNDGSVRDWQAHSVAAGKNFFRSGSWGPVLLTADAVPDWQALRLLTRLNGRVVQDSAAGAMFFGIPELIAYISTVTPLWPGDVIATGSPEGTGATQSPPRFLRSGDAVEFEVDAIGVLRHLVA